MAKILTDILQNALNLTDNWHLPWVFLLTTEDLIVLYFLKKTRFKAFPLFLSDNVIKCTLIWILLAAGRLSSKFP